LSQSDGILNVNARSVEDSFALLGTGLAV